MNCKNNEIKISQQSGSRKLKKKIKGHFAKVMHETLFSGFPSDLRVLEKFLFLSNNAER